MLAGLDLSIDAPDSVTQMPSVASANNGQGAFQTGMQLRQLHIAPQTVFDALCVQPSRVADGLPDLDAAEAQRTWGRYWSGATSPRHQQPNRTKFRHQNYSNLLYGVSMLPIASAAATTSCHYWRCWCCLT